MGIFYPQFLYRVLFAAIMRRSICTVNIPPPPTHPGILRAFDTLPYPRSGEFDLSNRCGGGAFDTEPRDVGHLTPDRGRSGTKFSRSHTCTMEYTLKDFSGQDNSYVAEWLQKNGMQKLIDTFERKYLHFSYYIKQAILV